MTTRSKRSVGRRRKKTMLGPRRVRLAIECTSEERKRMKMLAAHEDKTLNEFVLESVRMRIYKCTRPHVPNKVTRKTMKEAEAGENLIRFDSMEGFFKSLE